MISVPFTVAWINAVGITMAAAERGMLMPLMAYVCEHECLLPIDLGACQRIAGVTTSVDRRILDRVLVDHFDIAELGRVPKGMAEMLYLPSAVELKPASGVTLSVTSCDVAVTSSVTSGGVTQKEQAKLRQQLMRQRKAPLRAQALAMGLHPRKNASLAELQTMVGVTPGRHGDVTASVTPRDLRVGVRADLPSLNTNTNTNTEDRGSSVTPIIARAHRVAAELTAAGLEDVRPGDALFRRLLAEDGEQELLEAAREYAPLGKPFRYVLMAVVGRRRDAASLEIPTRPDPLEGLLSPEMLARVRGHA